MDQRHRLVPAVFGPGFMPFNLGSDMRAKQCKCGWFAIGPADKPPSVAEHVLEAYGLAPKAA